MQVRDYVIRRLLKLPLMLFLVSVLVFAISRLGGSPIAIYLDHEQTPEQVAQLEERFGLNDSLPEQYLAWLGGVLQGDLGYSGVAAAPVAEVLPDKFAATLELGLLATIATVVFGVGMGTFAGARRDKFADHAMRVISVSGASLPLFWFALLVLILFYLVLGWAPLGRSTEDVWSTITHPTGIYTLDALLAGSGTAFLDAVRHLWLPVLVLGYEGAATIARIMRSSLVDELGSDYVDAARAKGLPRRLVVKRHARRNALIPAVTVMGVAFGIILQGAVVVESIFQWPGMGRWIADAVLRGDQATVMTFVLVIAVIFLLVNLAVDVAYAYLDRRIELT
jgi:peptide/nickel transport system permease protein